MKARYATRKHMEWVGGAHIAGGGDSWYIGDLDNYRYTPRQYLILIPDGADENNIIWGDLEMAEADEVEWIRQVLQHRALSSLVVALWDENAEWAESAEIKALATRPAHTPTGTQTLIRGIRLAFEGATPRTQSWADAYSRGMDICKTVKPA